MGGEAVGRDGGDILAIERNGARHDVGHAEQRLQQGRFPGAVGPGDRTDLASVDFEVDAVQDAHLAIAGDELFDLEEAHDGSVRARVWPCGRSAEVGFDDALVMLQPVDRVLRQARCRRP